MISSANREVEDFKEKVRDLLDLIETSRSWAWRDSLFDKLFVVCEDFARGPK